MVKLFKRFIAVAVIICFGILLAGCGKTADIPQDYKDLNLDEYITVGDYEGLEYTAIDTEVTREEIDKYTEDVLSTFTEYVDVTTGEVKKDSVIKVDYQGVIDGEVSDLATGQDLQVDVANGSFIDGFKEGMVGHKVGDEFTLHLKFPDDYGNTELAGKNVDFNITIKSIVENKVPELTEDFIKENTDFETIADYEADVEKTLKEEKDNNARDSQRNELFLKIMDSSEVLKYPEEIVAARADKIKKTYQDLAEQNGMDYAAVIEMYTGLTEEDFDAQVQTAAENAVKQELVLNALANKEGIKISGSEYTKFLDDLLADNDLDRDSFEEQFGETIFDYANENDLYSAMLYQRVMDAVIEKSVAK